MSEFLDKNGITLESYMDKDTDIICVFGCLLTEAGKKIKEEMLPWILEKYDCIVVNQEAPGKLFEYPALKMARCVSMKYNKPVLYLHTKGAAHSKNVYDQTKCRLVWHDEFINHYDFYKEHIDLNKPQVLCPFIDTSIKTTILNGFIATPKAWAIVNVYYPSGDKMSRLMYEHLFRNTPTECIGRVFNDASIRNKTSFNKVLKYIADFGKK